MGRSLAKTFARRGWKVAAIDIDIESVRSVVDEIKTVGGEGFAEYCDISDPASIEALRTRVEKEWGGADVLINNAGVGAGGSVLNVSEQDLRYVFNTNFFGSIRMIQAFVPYMMERNSGHVINISSIAAYVSPPDMAAYNMSKMAVISMSECLSNELQAGATSVSEQGHDSCQNVRGSDQRTDLQTDGESKAFYISSIRRHNFKLREATGSPFHSAVSGTPNSLIAHNR